MRIEKILVVAERASGSQAALQKAVMIARHFGAAIELFTCDAEHAFALGGDVASDAIVTRCLAESRRFLDALRGSISARDVDFTTAVACAASVGEGVCTHVQRSAPSLVIKSFTDAGVAPAPLPSVTDLYLMRRCSAPLLLTHGRSWHPVPRIGVPEQSVRSLLSAAQHLAAGCHGNIETIDIVRDTDIDVLTLPVDGSKLAEQVVARTNCDLLLVPDPVDGQP